MLKKPGCLADPHDKDHALKKTARIPLCGSLLSPGRFTGFVWSGPSGGGYKMCGGTRLA